MSYHHFITVRMSGAMRAELDHLVATRNTDIGKLVRELRRRLEAVKAPPTVRALLSGS